VPNGDFTVKSPNPEEPEALTMALALADKTNADIVVGTDPDCDRLGLLLEIIMQNGFAKRQSNYDFDDCFPT
jgi:phosphomannomutase